MKFTLSNTSARSIHRALNEEANLFMLQKFTDHVELFETV